MIVYAYDWGCCDDVALALCAGIDIQKNMYSEGARTKEPKANVK
jgi:hypothetical protein